MKWNISGGHHLHTQQPLKGKLVFFLKEIHTQQPLKGKLVFSLKEMDTGNGPIHWQSSLNVVSIFYRYYSINLLTNPGVDTGGGSYAQCACANKLTTPTFSIAWWMTMMPAASQSIEILAKSPDILPMHFFLKGRSLVQGGMCPVFCIPGSAPAPPSKYCWVQSSLYQSPKRY